MTWFFDEKRPIYWLIGFGVRGCQYTLTPFITIYLNRLGWPSHFIRKKTLGFYYWVTILYIYILYTFLLWFFPFSKMVTFHEEVLNYQRISNEICGYNVDTGISIAWSSKNCNFSFRLFAFQKRLKTRCQGRLSAPWSHQAFSALRTGGPVSCNDSNGHQWAIRWPTMVQPKGNTYWKILEVKGDLECTRLVPSQICEVFMTSFWCNKMDEHRWPPAWNSHFPRDPSLEVWGVQAARTESSCRKRK